MPTLDENIRTWGSNWDWSTQGEEWSRWWGDTPAFWHGVILPRIHAMVPAGRILEIAPGYGRWTQYLKDLCDELVIVDLTEKCIANCRERFSEATNIEYHINDGRSLDMIEDESLDFVFSFDSLVHADSDVIGGYLLQLTKKLRTGGVGFIHHSNAGALQKAMALTRRVPERFYGRMVDRGLAVHLGAWRDEGMSATLFREQCQAAGLSCISQELVSWEHGGYLLDSFSMFATTGSRWDRETQIVRNPLFVAEARRMARLYAGASFS